TRNVRQPVLFGPTMEQAMEAGFTTVLEVSPHPILVTAVEGTAQHVGRPAVVLSSLRRDHDEMTELLTSLGRLHCQGSPVNWSALQTSGARAVSLPNYPWQHRRFWIEAAADRPALERTARGSRRPSPVSRALRVELEKRGNRVVAVHAGPRYTMSPDGEFTVDPERPDDFRRLLEETGEPGEAWAGTVHLWGLDAGASGGHDGGPATNANRACIGGLHLVQALGASSQSTGGRLWIVTQGAQALGAPRALTLAQAPLWGLGPVVGVEHPALWGGLVDMDSAVGPDAIGSLADEISSRALGERVAFRDGCRYVARLEHAEVAEAADPLRLRPDRAYVVTGGLGGIGRRLAQWLVARGARHLVLLGRHASADTAADLVQVLEAAGARVMVDRADVANGDDLAALLDRIPR